MRVWWAPRVALGGVCVEALSATAACATSCSYINWWQPLGLAALPRDTLNIPTLYLEGHQSRSGRDTQLGQH